MPILSYKPLNLCVLYITSKSSYFKTPERKGVRDKFMSNKFKPHGIPKNPPIDNALADLIR